MSRPRVQVRDNRVIVTEQVIWVILGLQSTELLQPPGLVAVHRLGRLVSVGVVDVGTGKKVRGAGVPEIAGFFGPGDGGFVESGVGVVGYRDEAWSGVSDEEKRGERGKRREGRQCTTYLRRPLSRHG